jgi:hypothetical protein
MNELLGQEKTDFSGLFKGLKNTQQVFNAIRLSTRAKSDRKKTDFHGVSRYFHPFKVPSKADAGKSSCI